MPHGSESMIIFSPKKEECCTATAIKFTGHFILIFFPLRGAAAVTAATPAWAPHISFLGVLVF